MLPTATSRARPLRRPSTGSSLKDSVCRPRGLVLAIVVVLALMVVRKAFFYPITDIPVDRKGDCGYFGWEKSSQPRKVYDTFSFNSEFDVLEVRLNELKDVVHKHILVEAEYAFSGKRKVLFFDEAKNTPRWAPYLDRIEHVIIRASDFDDIPEDAAAAAVERKILTKAGIVQGLDRAGASPEDLVIFSDLDEIPKKHVIETLGGCAGYPLPVSLHMRQYIYDFGCQEVEPPFWDRIRIARRDQLVERCGSMLEPITSGHTCPDGLRDPQHLRLSLTDWSPVTIRDAGWHISYFMSHDKIREKLESISHIERNTPENKREEYLQCLVCRCKHVNKRDWGHRSLVTSTSGVPEWAVAQFRAKKEPYSGWFPAKDDVCDNRQVLSLCD